MSVERICLVAKSAKYSGAQMGLSAICAALNFQASQLKAIFGLPTVPLVSLAPPVGPNDWAMNFYDSAAQQGALGDHFEQDGKPVMEVFLDPIISSGGTFTHGSNSASACASHEMIEAIRNPCANLWADMPDGSDVAFEYGDPVENDTYNSPGGVALSNFVLAAWFDPQSTGAQYDFMKKLKAPFTMSAGGYMIVRTEPGTVQDTFQRLGVSHGRSIHVLGKSLTDAKIAKLKRKFGHHFTNGEISL